ncbi:unnamed protein product [Rhizoctonia solani]|uniref:Uncharacterized protein n=1 Tax=Rhizoctonia solani TaxID=456999 RepID=A0A8H3AM09_9AGAM|nr:unnamed protein product [Rhizoctonia solani]
MEDQLNAQYVPESTSILVVATGGSSGLGLEALATYVKQSKNDIILVLGCRNPNNPTISTRLGEAPNVRKLDTFELELTSDDSIRRFATHVLETYSQRISVLLLCAGAMYAKRIVDSSGIEQTLKVNVLSQGLLLECLWPRLLDPAGGMACSRVVFVASSLHKKAAQQYEVSPSSIDSLLNGNPWKSMSAYSISKIGGRYEIATYRHRCQPRICSANGSFPRDLLVIATIHGLCYADVPVHNLHGRRQVS